MKHRYIQNFGNFSILKISLIISLLLVIITFIGFSYARYQNFEIVYRVSSTMLPRFGSTFLLNTLLIFVLFKYQFWILQKYQNRPWITSFFVFFGSLVLLFILSPMLSNIQWIILDERRAANPYLSVFFFKDLVVMVITNLFTALVFMWNKNQQTLLELQKISTESILNKYEALKNQLDPHFLFNSLNTLNGLIGYNDDKAHEYVDRLSSVFRYIMQSKKITLLENESEFAESYIYLMKIRYGDGLQVDIHIDEKYCNYYILPLSLQLLIENAVKHNVISNRYPIRIAIETTDADAIKVSNSIKPKPNNTKSGIGLSNLNERYAMLFNKEIKITNTEDIFEVEIPLIRDITEYNDKFNDAL